MNSINCTTPHSTPAFCSSLPLSLPSVSSPAASAAADTVCSATWSRARRRAGGASLGSHSGLALRSSMFISSASRPRRHLPSLSDSSSQPSHSGGRHGVTRMTLAATPASTTNAAHDDDDELVRELHGVDDYLDALRAHSDELLVLKIYAPWCRSCRALVPKMNRLARQFRGDVRFVKLNYEENKELCRRLGVYSMPTFIVYHGSVGEVDKFTCGPARAGVLSRKVVDIMRGYCLFEEHRDKQVKQPAYNKK